MFICAVTKRSAPSGEKPTRLVVETRPRTYQCFDEYGDPFTTTGTEIVKEINVSKEGLNILEAIRTKDEA